jgi:hypothetical protein
MFPAEGPAIYAGRDRLDLIALAPNQRKAEASVREKATDPGNRILTSAALS